MRLRRWLLPIAEKILRKMPESPISALLMLVFQDGADRFIEYSFAMRNLPSLRAHTRILDIGCTGSMLTPLVASLGYEVTGLDLSRPSILDVLGLPNFSFQLGDARRMKFGDGFFDAVLLVSTLEHIGIGGRYGSDEDREGDKKAIKEIARTLKPKGLLILTVPFGRPVVVRPYHRIYDYEHLRNLTRGFIIEEEEYFMKTCQGGWTRCSRQAALSQEGKVLSYALALWKLRRR
jgi:SAM-dependent methyltransferase